MVRSIDLALARANAHLYRCAFVDSVLAPNLKSANCQRWRASEFMLADYIRIDGLPLHASLEKIRDRVPAAGVRADRHFGGSVLFLGRQPRQLANRRSFERRTSAPCTQSPRSSCAGLRC